MNKHLGLILVTAGVSITAIVGARNPDQANERLAAEGKAKLLTGAETRAHTAYCEARAEARLPIADACPDPEAKDKPKAGAKAEPKKNPTRDELLSAARAELEGLKASQETLNEDLTKLRTTWLNAKEAAMEPNAIAATLGDAASGTDRVTAWLGLSGLPALLGLGLILAGAMVARKARVADANEPTKKTDTTGPRDFGEQLRELQAALETLTTEFDPEAEPTDKAAVVQRIETVHYDLVEPLTEAGIRVQTRFGIAGFAAIFSPLSGGERGLNRAWSALVDDHWPEACNAVRFAKGQIDMAVEELDKLL